MRFDDLNQSHVYWLNCFGEYGKRTYALGLADIAFQYLGKVMLAEGNIEDDIGSWSVREVSLRELYMTGSYWAEYAADESAGLND